MHPLLARWFAMRIPELHQEAARRRLARELRTRPGRASRRRPG
ncbi:MAG TPA: hypothetical protein VF486_24140 [Actinomycetes bacterium]